MVRIAIIGYDHVHILKYLPTIANHPDADLVAIVALEKNKKQAKAAAKEYNCTYTDSVEKAFAEMEHSILEYKNGDKIINEGDQSLSMFLLLKGTGLITKTQDDAKIRLSKLKAGELFGEMSFFSQKPRQSDVVATDDALVLTIDNDFFKKMPPDIKDKIKTHIIELLVRRLEEMNASIMKLSKIFHL